jgi:uncharacterized protein with PQ loop repeat
MIGWIGATLLAFCGLPEMIRTLRTKRCHLSWGFLGMWGFGEVFTLIPVIADELGAFLVMNYSVNLAIILVLVYYKCKEEANVQT